MLGALHMKKINMLVRMSILGIVLCLVSLGVSWYTQINILIPISFITLFVFIGLGFVIRRLRKSKAEFKKMYNQLQESENRFRSAFDYAAVGMALLSPRGRYLKVNRTLCEILGYSENELLAMSIRHMVHPDDFSKEFPQIRSMIRGDTTSYQAVQRYFHKNGEVIWIMSSVSLVRNIANKPVYLIAQFQNISAEKTSEDKLRHMAYHDPLTELANRNRLEQYLNELITEARRSTDSFSLIALDLDYFKKINDTLGHDAGDSLLGVVAERLKNTVRGMDMVARVGGDEFVIVISGIVKAEIIAQIAQKILNSLIKPMMLKGREIYITTSIGISLYPHDGQDIETLMKNADLALYRVKESGRNNFQFCTPDITKKAQEKSDRQNALSHALVKDEFLLYYQPSIDTRTKTINSVEALLRWQSKEYGLVTPESIISIAEETGLIVPLSEWVLRAACKQVKKWQAHGSPSLKLAINLSARQFKNIDFIENILHTLRETEFAPHNLILEITESLIMQDPEKTIKTLAKLKEAGICIVIDDFGTGFSSFSYLSNYSVDKIKIDKTFVQDLTVNQTTVSIVSAMIAMANKLGIKAIAEGVETKEQYDILVREGCNEIQGYYISKPLTVQIMESFLATKTIVIPGR